MGAQPMKEWTVSCLSACGTHYFPQDHHSQPQGIRAVRVTPMSKLDREEKDLLEAFAAGRLKSVKNRTRELARHRKVATATFAKDSRINIRISSKDLRALQKRALAEGMPYQTLVSSVLHKFVAGQMAVQPASKRQQRER
jgi:predicted DNA binding CopG/RHH family protein